MRVTVAGLLLMFERGRGMPTPNSTEKFGSNYRERSKPLGHSRKPDFYRHMMSTMTGHVPVLELFAHADLWIMRCRRISTRGGTNRASDTKLVDEMIIRVATANMKALQ